MYASGSPFDDVTLEMPGGAAKTFRPGQGNNAYIFPVVRVDGMGGEGDEAGVGWREMRGWRELGGERGLQGASPCRLGWNGPEIIQHY